MPTLLQVRRPQQMQRLDEVDALTRREPRDEDLVFTESRLERFLPNRSISFHVLQGNFAAVAPHCLDEVLCPVTGIHVPRPILGHTA